jgi:hypothetical protein
LAEAEDYRKINGSFSSKDGSQDRFKMTDLRLRPKRLIPSNRNRSNGQPEDFAVTGKTGWFKAGSKGLKAETNSQLQ